MLSRVGFSIGRPGRRRTGPIVLGPTTVSITTPSVTKPEGDAVNTDFIFNVTRTGDISGTSSVNWATTGSTGNPADASDFVGGVLPSGTVSFLAGEISKQIIVSVAGDTTFEPDEGFTVTLSNPVGCILGTSTATGTITNDDSTPAGGSLSAGTIAFDASGGWVSGQNPPKFLITCPNDGSVQAGDWFKMIASPSPTFASGNIDGGWHQISSDDLLASIEGTGFNYVWPSQLPGGSTYFEEFFGRGADAAHITTVSPASNVLNDTLAGSAGTAQLVAVNGVDKAAWMTVTGTPKLTAQGTAFVNSYQHVRSDIASPNTKFQMELTLVSGSSGGGFDIFFGLDDTTENLNSNGTNDPGYIPGNTGYAAKGVSVEIVTSGQIIYSGGTSSNETVHLPVLGDTYSYVVDRSGGNGTHSVTVYLTHAGVTTQVLQRTGLTIPMGWKAFVGTRNDEKVNMNFGETAFVRPLDAGFTFYG